MAAGRPSSLTPQLRQKICRIIRRGNYHYVAAQRCGIGITTFRRWMQQGKRDQSGRFKQFRDAVLEAEKSAETYAVGMVYKAGKTDINHLKWWLERKCPNRWGANRDVIRQLIKDVSALKNGAKP